MGISMKLSEIGRETIKAKKTVLIFRLRTGGAVFLFLLSFSYVVTALLFGQSAAYGRRAENDRSRITVWARDGEMQFVLDMDGLTREMANELLYNALLSLPGTMILSILVDTFNSNE